MVPDFVQHRLSHLLDQFLLTPADGLDGFLKDEDRIRHSPGILDAALGPGPADIQPQQQIGATHSQAAKLLTCWPFPNLDRHFLKIPQELLRKICQRLLHQLVKA